MLYYLIPIIIYWARCFQSKKIFTYLNWCIAAWLLIPILLQVPLGGDFNSLNERASFEFDDFNFGLTFDILLYISRGLNFNIASLYGVISYGALFIYSIKTKNHYLCANLFIFIFLIVGFQRQGLSIILVFIAYELLRNNSRSLSLALQMSAFVTHESSIIFITIIWIAYFLKNIKLRRVIYFTPFLIYYFADFMSGIYPAFDHFKKYYYDEAMQAQIFYFWFLYYLVLGFFTYHILDDWARGIVLICLYCSLSIALFGGTSAAGRVLFYGIIIMIANLQNLNRRDKILSATLEMLLILIWLLLSEKASQLWWINFL
jgi:hypothetical protein